ncbi:hypothetical protein D3M59_09060 [Sphingomonas edaphi]|uniref:Uncharacterized protein n=1 Tax=Sphingomonas edaphi TaxID=2315689 RepID=A0A418Q0Q5_9SPHN|nr:hypothetical protein D3M59_09060 [Sphingomonas edaphi]
MVMNLTGRCRLASTNLSQADVLVAGYDFADMGRCFVNGAAPIAVGPSIACTVDHELAMAVQMP